MAEKWTIRKLEQVKNSGTQLQYGVFDETGKQLEYEVRDETGEVVSLHFWGLEAKQMAAVPLLRDALYDALAFIEEVARDCGVVPEDDVLKQITAALEAVKGE